ncbi:hypothetical protein E2605_07685 [Dysgonomonas capnocytophagoides]|uniref:Uncharacterized protein n=1 Tax=Dysgonomonas capnocytophagoides TaxID=45254 RepID=A0A4Y8L5B6_9BACT|nr:hypothetical protein [Dysgonomonas capnocytophagoides]TFD96692.1 hypothetical protein E2605_07685 [Dysgonomonas capnocytophagoides]
MKANEIRIGNLFTISGFPMYIEAIFKDTVYLNFEGNEGDVWEENTKDLEPIPLTEEILIKAGATKIEDDHVYLMLQDAATHLILMKSGEHWYPSIEQEPEFSNFDSNIVALNRIESVHQLQNLCFALTGEEIKIDLE